MQPNNQLHVIDRPPNATLYPQDVRVGDTVLVYRCIDWQAPLLLPPFFEAGRWHYGHSRWQWVERTVTAIVWDGAAPGWKLKLANDPLGAYVGNGAGMVANYRLSEQQRQAA